MQTCNICLSGLGYLTQYNYFQLCPFTCKFDNFILVIFHIFITHSSADGPLVSFPSQRCYYGSTYIILNNSLLLSKKIVIIKDDLFITSIKIGYRSLAWRKLGSLACKNTAFIRAGRMPWMEMRRSCSTWWLQWLSCHSGAYTFYCRPCFVLRSESLKANSCTGFDSSSSRVTATLS